jgi:hypothetical protein
MSHEDAEVIAQLREAHARARGHADFFGWPVDRDLEEWGIVSTLAESLQNNNKGFFREVKLRGRSNDPLDCEALNAKGERIAIEVTELVAADAIRSFTAGRHYDWQEWARSRFLEALSERIAAEKVMLPET